MTHKEIIQSLAIYNQKTNVTLISVLEPHHQRWEEETGSYFKTLKGLLNHLIAGDTNWLRRWADFGFVDATTAKAIADIPLNAGNEWKFESWEQFKELRYILDQLFVGFTESISDKRLDEQFVYGWQWGKTKIAFGISLLHVFNHQAHHRGAISQILDAMGIQNDYSGFSKHFSEKVE
jgi:uncharacterized damage-inducible protein DinB